MKVREASANNDVTVHAIAGTHAVLIAMDIREERRNGLIGFAIERTDPSRPAPGNRRWLSGARTALGTTNAQDEDTSQIRSENILQTFLWGDYTARPDTNYLYRVVALYGTPTEPTFGPEITVEVKTENPDSGTHAIYFNRGVAGSQAYSREFGKYRRWYKFEKNGQSTWREFVRPEDIPERKAYTWLSRGLEEALLKFIRQATGPEYSLRAAVYEFTYVPVIQEFVDALERGVDVKIIHHAKQEKMRRLKQNHAAQVTVTFAADPSATVLHERCAVVTVQSPDTVCSAARMALRRVGVVNPASRKRFDKMMIERQDTTISHNKFIVLLKDGKPIQVWTGSTNLTASGIFGQSNVGHIIRDENVARKYLDYWEKLKKDPPRETPAEGPADASIRDWTVAQQPDLTGPPPPSSITPVFSPRRTKKMLEWYAERLDAAQNSVFFTAAFTVADEIFKKVIQTRSVPSGHPYLRYLLLESNGGKMREKFDQMRTISQNQIAWGDVRRSQNGASTGQPGAEELIETLTGLNMNVEFLHTKYMLIDPLSDDPIVITGSANFSKASTVDNDENMLIIRGDTCVADIFVTEFMRLFNHFQSRNKANARNSATVADNPESPSSEPDDSWTTDYFTAGTPEYAERLLFR